MEVTKFCFFRKSQPVIEYEKRKLPDRFSLPNSFDIQNRKRLKTLSNHAFVRKSKRSEIAFSRKSIETRSSKNLENVSKRVEIEKAISKQDSHLLISSKEISLPKEALICCAVCETETAQSDSFGPPTCVKCRQFFITHVFKPGTLTCTDNLIWKSIPAVHLLKCRKCRFDKCIQVGMGVKATDMKSCLICKTIEFKIGINHSIQSCKNCGKFYSKFKDNWVRRAEFICLNGDECFEKGTINKNNCFKCRMTNFENLFKETQQIGRIKYQNYIACHG
jgi:hypothetical protein